MSQIQKAYLQTASKFDYEADCLPEDCKWSNQVFVSGLFTNVWGSFDIQCCKGNNISVQTVDVAQWYASSEHSNQHKQTQGQLLPQSCRKPLSPCGDPILLQDPHTYTYLHTHIHNQTITVFRWLALSALSLLKLVFWDFFFISVVRSFVNTCIYLFLSRESSKNFVMLA